MNRSLAWAAACAALSGYLSLSYEILWYRVYAFTTGGTISVFGLFLGVYLIGIAYGAFFARRLCGSASTENRARIARWASGLAVGAGAVAHLHNPLVACLAEYNAPLAAVSCAGLAAGLYGAILPLVSHAAVPPDGVAGQRVSYVYFGNILGGCAGSILTGFVLLEFVGAQGGSTVLLGLSGVLALALLRGPDSERAGRAVRAWAVVGITIGLLASTPFLYNAFYERLLYKSPEASEHPFADVIENRSGIVAITKSGAVFGSGVYDGRLSIDLRHDSNMIYRAYALAGLHPAPGRVAMIGLGSGSWAQVIAHNRDVQHLTIVEINSGYVEILQRNAIMRSLLDNPKVEILIDDGRRWLRGLAPTEKYDAVIMNTTFHWRANTSHLLSTEFFELVAAHLAPGGIFYFNATGSAAAARTACVSFSFGFRFGNFMAVGDQDFLFNIDEFNKAIRTYEIDGRRVLGADAETWLNRTLPALVAENHLEPCASILARTQDERLVTDDNLVTETTRPWHWAYRPDLPTE